MKQLGLMLNLGIMHKYPKLLVYLHDHQQCGEHSNRTYGHQLHAAARILHPWLPDAVNDILQASAQQQQSCQKSMYDISEIPTLKSKATQSVHWSPKTSIQ
jgi:hypothetical protein